jgi:hypothetical protein
LRTDDDAGRGDEIAVALHGRKQAQMRLTILFAALCAALIVVAPASAAPTWLPAQTFESNLGTQPSADVAVTPNGTAVAIWVATEGADQRAKVRVRLPGQGFGAVTTLTPADGSDATAPTVAVDNNGNATLAWQESAGPGGIQTIRAAVVSSGAVAPGAPQTVSNAANQSVGPVLAVGAGGTAVIVYTETLMAQQHVSAAIRNGAAGNFAAAVPISADVAAPFAFTPSVAVDDAGDAVAVWMEVHTNPTVVANQRSAGGAFGAVGTVQEVSNSTTTSSTPVVAMAPNGTAVAMWSQGSPSVVAYNERTPAGAWLPDSKVASPPGVSAFNPKLGFDGSGNAIAVWNAVSGPASFLQAGIRPAGGAFGGGNFRDLTATSGFNVDIAVNRAGDAIITYSGSMSELIGSVRRSRTGAFTGVIPAELKPVSSTSSTALMNAGVGIDDEGNATGIWTRNLVPPNVWAVAAGAFDAAPPTLASSVPPGGTAGVAVPMAAAASDRLTPASINWTFGDGTTGVGGALSHVFGSAGAFNVSVTATDAVGNATTQTHPVLVAKKPPKRIRSKVRVTWGVAGKRIFLLRMQIVKAPKRTKAELRCADKKKGPQCPFKRVSSKKRKKGTITLFKEVKAKNVIGKKKRSFHAGQTLQVRITKKGFIGKVVRYKLEKGRIPSGKDLCLPPGKKKPRKRC